MSLRIAFCGPNQELNEKLAFEARELLYGVDDISLVENPLNEVVRITRREGFQDHDIDWMNLWAASVRRMHLEGVETEPIVISSSCGIDQVSYQAAWLDKQVNSFGETLIAVDAQGQQLMQQREAYLNRSGAVFTAILNSAEEEVADYWDYIYAVLPAIIVNPGPPGDVLAQYDDFLKAAPAFEDVVRLPDNEDAAKDGLTNQVTRWKQRLASS